LGVGLTTLRCKKKIVEKLPRNLVGFCGGSQGLRWAVEPRKERKKGVLYPRIYLEELRKITNILRPDRVWNHGF